MKANNEICKKIKDTIHKYSMINAGDTVIIGVSGGADSMALLKFFIENKEFYNINILAAHVNHCLRGWESDRDENFVREFCKENSVDLEILRIEIKNLAEKAGMGIEEYAREARYEFFSQLANRFKAKIATAHTLSDSLETVILNLTRGTGPKGLSGIPPVRGKIIRPLIDLKRIETETFCSENGVPFVIDSTNLNDEYTRNKIRLDVIPVLKSLNSSLEDCASRLMFMQKEDSRYFETEIEILLKKLECEQNTYVLEGIKELPYSLKSRFILKAAYKFCGICLEFSHVNLIVEIINAQKGSVNFCGNACVVVKDGLLKFFNISEKNKQNVEEKILPLRNLQINGKKIVFNCVDRKEYDEKLKINKMLFINAVDCDTINNETVIRNRRGGDKFCKAGRNVTKLVKKLFNEEKIPVCNRDKVLMIANGSNVLWIDGYGVSSEAKIKKKTKKVLLIFLEEANNA